MLSEKIIETDVLVIGGGMAGCFAAIKAREHGAAVVLIDKGYVGKTSGIQLFTGELQVFNPEKGHKLDKWMEEINVGGEYLNNKEWTEIVIKESFDIYNDLVSWGIPFIEPDYKNLRRPHVLEYVVMTSGQYLPALRKKTIETGVTILDRIMAADLLKQEGKVVGAIGFHATKGDLYIFQAKATIIATGGSSLKSGNMPVYYWSGDGEAMAYRAGAEITGKEFKNHGQMPLRDEVAPKQQEQTGRDLKELDILTRFPFFRGSMAGPIIPTVNAEGGPIISPIWEAHCGRVPLFTDVNSLTPGQKEYIQNMYREWKGTKVDGEAEDIFKDVKLTCPIGTVDFLNVFGGAGIWPIDKQCATSLPGLYAVGTNCATRAAGTSYPGMGFALTHCAVTGTRAGHAAAGYAAKSGKLKLDEAELKRFQKATCAPIERKGGFSPGWVTQFIQSLTTPYFILHVKHGERLKAALTLIEFVNSHLVPKIMARDAHEWRMAHETKNMALDTEMRLRASLARTESRGTHFREDYPRRNDPTWLAWLKLKDDNGKMKVSKVPIPKKWWPELSEPYEKRYPHMFPGE